MSGNPDEFWFPAFFSNRRFVHQYHVKDHLGNVRATFTTLPLNQQFTAGFEAANQTSEASGFQNYPNGAHINNVPGNAHTGTSSLYLNGGYSGGQIGLAKSFSVSPGDSVSISAYATYHTPTSNPTDLTAFATALLAAFNLTPPVQGELGTGRAALNTWGAAEPSFGDGNSSDQTDPKVFVTILIFDKNYNLLDFAFKRVTSSGSLIKAGYLVKQRGYAYMYVSNEQTVQTDVYFDDITMALMPSPVVQQDDYYPFGLTFNSYSRENSVSNRWKFQGQEHVDDLGLNWDQFKWRNYQPDIGRFFNVDPLAAKYVYNSPYAFSENDVISSIELEGLQRVRFTNFSPMQSNELKQEFEKTQGLNLYEDSREGNDKIMRSRKEIERIVNYGLKHGFFDPKGDKARYIINKLKQSRINLSSPIERNLRTTNLEVIDEGGDFIIEYFGVGSDNKGNISGPTKLGEINRSAEERYRKLEFLRIFIDDFFPLPEQLFRLPIGPFDFDTAPKEGQPEANTPAPTPSPTPAPTPQPPIPIPDPPVTASKDKD